MTFVDDNLLGTGPVRSGKPGSKSAGKSLDLDTAHQRSAFENAFADAGKKKQPVVSISAKSGVEGNPVANLKSADAKTSVAESLAASSKGNSAEALAIDADGNGLSPLQDLSTEDDGFMKSSLGPAAAAGADAMGKTNPAQDSPTTEKGDKPQKFSLMQMHLAGIGEDVGKTVDGPIGEKIASLHADANLTKRVNKTATSDDAAALNQPGDAGKATDAATADVSQLLTLLDATQKPVAASQPASAEPTPAMSEFQALAERAGKAKPAAKDNAKAGASASGDANAVKNATQAGSDQVFRFARADGKGQAVSMSVTSDGDKTVAKNEASPTTAKAETVTVLEARRYLGLAPSGNAAVVTSQIASNPEWARALQPSAGSQDTLTQASTGKVLNTLKIQMHPIDLGMVTATLRLKDDELHVEIKVETGDAFRQLSDDQSAMVKALRAQGFAVDQVNIVFNASDTSGSNNAQQQAQPQTGQQGRETAGDGAKGQRNDNGGQEQGRERWTGNDGTSDTSSGAELNRTGDVYM
jgi:chemotaxis protein MotD